MQQQRPSVAKKKKKEEIYGTFTLLRTHIQHVHNVHVWCVCVCVKLVKSRRKIKNQDFLELIGL